MNYKFVKYKTISIPLGDRVSPLPVIFRFFVGLPSAPIVWLVETASSDLKASPSPTGLLPPGRAVPGGLARLRSVNVFDKDKTGEFGRLVTVPSPLLLPPSPTMGDIWLGAGSKVVNYDWLTHQTLQGL